MLSAVCFSQEREFKSKLPLSIDATILQVSYIRFTISENCEVGHLSLNGYRVAIS